MISGRAIDYITQAVEAEEDAAIRAHGLFHSDHEAWAVLREEVEELCECLDEHPVSPAHCAGSQGTTFFCKAKKDIDNLWDKVRRDKKIGNDDVKEIFYWAKSCAEEAVQVMAMIQKWGESVERREQEEGRSGGDEAGGNRQSGNKEGI